MKRYKFPRTFHLPCSESKTDDDKTLDDYSNFFGERVIITEKMDGESFSIYSDGFTHARSIDGRNHQSRNLAKRIAAFKSQSIPERWRLSCENLYAKHSVHYNDLKGYLYLFGAWDSNNNYISYDELVEQNAILELPMPKVLYDGEFDLAVINRIRNNFNRDESEGFVIRNAKSFSYDDYRFNTGKFVRKGHVKSDEHWMHQEIIMNKLR